MHTRHERTYTVFHNRFCFHGPWLLVWKLRQTQNYNKMEIDVQRDRILCIHLCGSCCVPGALLGTWYTKVDQTWSFRGLGLLKSMGVQLPKVYRWHLSMQLKISFSLITLNGFYSVILFKYKIHFVFFLRRLQHSAQTHNCEIKT